ncbi:MAG TPA: hypothetical protein VEY91_02405 [Candidatus Limnocylindria bacterium]|nr:hypothetical protein [Candidatus Limnocylindria bacterium]
MNSNGTNRLGGELIVASLLVALMTIGCGKQQSQPISSDVQPTTAVVAQQPGEVLERTTPASTIPENEGELSALAESQSPDLAVSTVDSLVAPGSFVEIVAEGSAEVVSMSLRDDFGKILPLVRDGASNLWLATYRVPMKVSKERVALSVTAKDGSHRWRRVWVFLNVRQETVKEQTQP